MLLSTHSVADIGDSFSYLIALGSGRITIDGPIDRILSSHAIMRDGPPDGAIPVGSFPLPDGRPATLVRVDGGPAGRGLQAASLGDVVMGYLAAGKADPR